MRAKKITVFLIVFLMLFGTLAFNTSAKEINGEVAEVGCEGCTEAHYEYYDLLSEQIAEATPLLSMGDKYTEDSFNSFLSEYENAVRSLENDLWPWDYIDAMDGLTDAIDALEERTYDELGTVEPPTTEPETIAPEIEAPEEELTTEAPEIEVPEEELTTEAPEIEAPTTDEPDVEEPETETPEEKEQDMEYVYGNVTDDTEINIKDATAIQKHLAGIADIGKKYIYADANGDGKININDATTIQKYVAGMEVLNQIGLPYKGNDAYVYVGDRGHYVYKGAEITYVAELAADQLFEDIQGVVNYNSNVLELVRMQSDDPDIANWEIEGPERCPYLDDVFFNADIENKVRFNASEVIGYNFKEKKVLIWLDFVVVSGGVTDIDLDIEYMTIKGDGTQMYFDNSEPVITDGIKVDEYLGYPVC